MSDKGGDGKFLSQNLNENIIAFIDYFGRKLFITVIFSILFLIGLVNVYSYLNYFGINHLIVDLPIFYFLIQAVLPIVAVLFIILLFLYVLGGIHKLLNLTPKRSKYKSIFIMEIIYSIIFYYFASEYIFPSFSPSYALIFINYSFAGVLIFSLIWKYWLNKIIINFSNKNEINMNQIYAMFFIFILILLIFTGTFKGKIDARNIVEDSNGRFIDFDWKENTPEEINNKELVLITYQKGNYYVVNHQNPAPEFPKVFIIHDDNINFATIRKIS